MVYTHILTPVYLVDLMVWKPASCSLNNLFIYIYITVTMQINKNRRLQWKSVRR